MDQWLVSVWGGDEKTHRICRVSSACLEEGGGALCCAAPGRGIKFNWYRLHAAGFLHWEALLMQWAIQRGVNAVPGEVPVEADLAVSGDVHHLMQLGQEDTWARFQPRHMHHKVLLSCHFLQVAEALGLRPWNSGVSHTLQDVESSSGPSFQSTSLDLGSTFHPFYRRRLCPVEVDCLARRNTHDYEICSCQKRLCWLKCLLSWCGESAVKICWIQLPSVWCLESGPQWLGNVSISGRIHGIMSMEGTLSQAAAENKPSLPHGSQKETGSSGYVCVVALTKQVHCWARLYVLQLS